jgi:hypothetical protein
MPHEVRIPYRDSPRVEIASARAPSISARAQMTQRKRRCMLDRLDRVRPAGFEENCKDRGSTSTIRGVLELA